MEEALPKLDHFILPGGSPAAAALHLARSACRRAERTAVALTSAPAGMRPYLNRLSDWLFAAARCVSSRRTQ
jgi:cob(I)alamin adenosyltransferase